MSDPHEVLGVSRHADEDEIRKRYLELVRAFPPDRAPERFAAIRAAYDEVRDPARRLDALLFDSVSSDTLESIADVVRARLRDRLASAPLDVLLSLATAP
jgi:curved DNA-binding protein CbpA